MAGTATSYCFSLYELSLGVRIINIFYLTGSHCFYHDASFFFEKKLFFYKPRPFPARFARTNSLTLFHTPPNTPRRFCEYRNPAPDGNRLRRFFRKILCPKQALKPPQRVPFHRLAGKGFPLRRLLPQARGHPKRQPVSFAGRLVEL